MLGDNIGFVELVNSMGDDLSIVNSARVSYGKTSEELSLKDEKLIEYLLKNNHSSPLEHVVFTFNVKVPLIIERQWNRHRSWKFWSFNEVSRRYTSENIEFYVPSGLRKQNEDNKQMSTDELVRHNIDFIREFNLMNRRQLKFYTDMIEGGVARELARLALPQSMYVSFYATVDLHNLFWFLELRRHPHAQWEIRKYAEAIEGIIMDKVPVAYKTWDTIMKEKYKED